MQQTATTLRIHGEQLERYYEALSIIQYHNTFDLMEAHVRAEEEWERTSHYASRIVDCPRAHWYGLRGVKKDTPFTLTQAVKFDLGNAIGDIMFDRLERAMTALNAQLVAGGKKRLPTILEAIEKWSPQLHADVLAAIERQKAEPEKMSKFRIGAYVVAEVPFRMQFDGFAFPLGARIDIAYVTPSGVPMIVELKSSSSFMTQMVRNNQDTIINYQLQAYTYMQRYGLPTELHYWDREWAYPYRFGFLQADDGNVYHQPGGMGRMGRPLAEKLNGMHPADYITARLEWYEEQLKSDCPPGEIVTGVIPAPRDKAGHFNGARLQLLPKHRTYLGLSEESYVIYYDDSGEIIAKKQADNVEYKTGICGKYCGYRGTCLGSAGVEIKPDLAADFSQWGAPAVKIERGRVATQEGTQ